MKRLESAIITGCHERGKSIWLSKKLFFVQKSHFGNVMTTKSGSSRGKHTFLEGIQEVVVENDQESNPDTVKHKKMP